MTAVVVKVAVVVRQLSGWLGGSAVRRLGT